MMGLADGGLSVHVFDLCRDLRSLLQHGRDRAVLLLRQPDCVLYRLTRHLTTYAVDQLDISVDGGWFSGALGFGADFEAAKRFALLLQDRDDVIARAAAQADEHEFHRAVASGLVAIDDNRVLAVSDAIETLLLNPGSTSVGHKASFSFILGSPQDSRVQSPGGNQRIKVEQRA